MDRSELVRWNGELYQLLLRCYAQVSILEEMERHNTETAERSKGMINASQAVVEQMGIAVRGELILNLWKLYFDPDKTSRTLLNYRANLRKFLRENLIFVNIKKRKCTPLMIELGDEIVYMREQYLTRLTPPERVDMQFLQRVKKVLEIIRGQFNETCRSEIDDVLLPLNSAELKKQQFTTTLGLGWMLEHSKIERNNPEKEEYT